MNGRSAPSGEWEAFGRPFSIGLLAGVCFAVAGGLLLYSQGLAEPLWGFQLVWILPLPGGAVAAAVAASLRGSSSMRVSLVACISLFAVTMVSGTLWGLITSFTADLFPDSGWLLRRQVAVSLVTLSLGAFMGTVFGRERHRPSFDNGPLADRF